MSEFMTVTQRAGHIDEILTKAESRESALEALNELLRMLDEEEQMDGADFTEPVFLLDVETAEVEEIIC